MTIENPKKILLAAAFSVGGIGLLTQTLLFRELSIVLRSNELIIGLLLSSWLLFAGIGSITGLFGPRWRGVYLWQTIGAALSIIWCHLLANFLTPGQGEIWPFWRTAIFIASAVAPTAFLTGAGFSALSRAFSRIGNPARIYIIEGLGALAGGLISLLFAPILPSRVILPLFAGLSFAGVLLFSISAKNRRVFALGCISLFVFLPLLNYLDSSLSASLRKGFDTVRHESAHGAIEVSTRFNETYLFQGGVYLGSSGDSILAEPIVLPLILHNPDPERILIMGGVLQGAVESALACDPKKITLLIEDPKALEIGPANFRAFRLLSDPRVEIITGDPGRSLRALEGEYDLAILFPGIPQSGATGRFLTATSFNSLSSLLSDNAITAVCFPVSPNVVTETEAALLSSVGGAMGALGEVNPYLVGGVAMLVAPDNGELGQKMRSGDFIDPHNRRLPKPVISELFEEFRQIALRDKIARYATQANSEKHPVALMLGLRRWERLASGKIIGKLSGIPKKIWFGAPGLLICIAAILVLLRKCRKLLLPSLSFFTGVFGMGIAVWLLYLFQLAAGQLYLAIGLLSSLFLLGTVLGARASSSGRVDFRGWRFSLLGLALLTIPLTLGFARAIPIWLAISVFGVYHLSAGWIVGAIYPLLLSRAKDIGIGLDRAPGVFYGLDLFGSAISAPVFGVLIIPSLGMIDAFILLGLLLGLIFIISLAARTARK